MKIWALVVDVRDSQSEYPLVRYQFIGTSIDEVEGKCRAHAEHDRVLCAAINEDGYMLASDYKHMSPGEALLSS